MRDELTFDRLEADDSFLYCYRAEIEADPFTFEAEAKAIARRIGQWGRDNVNASADPFWGIDLALERSYRAVGNDYEPGRDVWMVRVFFCEQSEAAKFELAFNVRR